MIFWISSVSVEMSPFLPGINLWNTGPVLGHLCVDTISTKNFICSKQGTENEQFGSFDIGLKVVLEILQDTNEMFKHFLNDCFLFVLLFEVGFCSVVQAVLKLTVFLPQLPRCWGSLTLQILRTKLKPYLFNLLTCVRVCVRAHVCECVCVCMLMCVCVLMCVCWCECILHLLILLLTCDCISGVYPPWLWWVIFFNVFLIGLCHSVLVP